MSGREWFPLEEWLKCQRPLCPLVVRHEGRVEHSQTHGVRVCFASRRVGGNFLGDGASQVTERTAEGPSGRPSRHRFN